MPILPGRRLGPYEILSAIGAGGMGEVYKARDTRLDRIVAIKVLPTHLADRSELRERFEREAKTIASLNHPHICTLHDTGHQDGTDYLVMEYLEGETLAQRLLKGSLPIQQVLQYAIEIADALDKAHRKGITHRDLKPGNIMVTKTGTKLLDFGLAKLKQEIAPTTPISQLPTMKSEITGEGTILGTLQYMAPEQVEARPVDARTDIFAFGAIVYEMATGRKAFEGKTSASVMAKILEVDPPPMSSLQPLTPPALDRVAKKCLAKDPDDRWHAAKDLCDELKWIAEGGLKVGMSASAAARRKIRERLSLAAAAALFLTTIGFGAAYLNRPTGGATAVRFSVFPPEKGTFDSGGVSGGGLAAGAISPDGHRLAFTARDVSGKILIWVRPLDAVAPQAMQGTDDAAFPFWSPDSRSIAFFAQGKLKRVEVAGGPPQTLCDAANGRGGTWNRDGLILFAPDTRSPLYRVPSTGGEPTTAMKTTAQQYSNRFPKFLPDGRHFLYFSLGQNNENSGVFVGTLDSNESKHLLSADTNALYAPSGELLFIRQGTLLRQSFDAKTLELSGDPTPVAEQVAAGGGLGLGTFSVSENGVLVYRNGPTATGNVQLAWLDRTGKPIETIGMPGGYRGVDVSADGTRIAFHRHDGNGGDIWLFDSARRTTSRFTFDASQDNSMPIWSPDGSRIVFSSLRNGKWGLYQKLANGTGHDELLIESDLLKIPMSWSPDGKFIVYWVTGPKTGSDEWVLPLAGDRKPFPFLQSPFNENHPQISPDGKWIAYYSDETGRREVYVRPFPSGEGKWQVSTNGGVFPRWRRDSKELFYMGAVSLGKMISVKVNPTGPTFEYGDSTELFDSGYVNFGHTSGVYHTYAVSPDGQRFLIPRPETVGSEEIASAPITVVVNWTSGLKK
jgi:eukaryotic-like serine/threonine-protein kinase